MAGQMCSIGRTLASSVAGAALGLAAALPAAAQGGPTVDPGGEAGQLVLRDLGFMTVGIETEEQADGSLNVINQMHVGYALPAERTHAYPLVLIHGGGGQATDWLGTPDGRDGWADYFIAAGFDVYWVDRPGYGRSPTNPGCGDGKVGGPGNTAFLSRLATADAALWPGGEPTPTNSGVIGWAATSPAGPYCGNDLAAKDISLLLDEIGPAILLAHSAGGTSAYWAADMNPDNVVGIIAFETGDGNPTGNYRTGLTWQPLLPADFAPVETDGCAMQGGDQPSQLVNYADIPVVHVGSEHNSSVEQLACAVAAWQQAGVEASYVYLPNVGHPGGGHFSMAQLDNGDIAQTFIAIATEIEESAAE